MVDTGVRSRAVGSPARVVYLGTSRSVLAADSADTTVSTMLGL